MLRQATHHMLEATLTDAERIRSGTAFPVPVRSDLSFGEFLTDAPDLVVRLAGASASERAIVRAAVDWRRMGAGRTIGEPTLRAVWKAWLQELTDRPPAADAFGRALAFATGAVAEDVMRYVEPTWDGFVAHDYFVAHREGADRRPADDANPVTPLDGTRPIHDVYQRHGVARRAGTP